MVSGKDHKKPLRDFCGSGLDIVRHSTPICSGRPIKKLFKNNGLRNSLRAENPCVGGSIPPRATSKIRVFPNKGGAFQAHSTLTLNR